MHVKLLKFLRRFCVVIFFIFIAAFMLLVGYFFVSKLILKQEVPFLFGKGTIVAVSNSMEPSISAGDLLIIEQTENYDIGDIVVFENDGLIMTHRIVALKDREFVTRGDSVEDADDNLLSANEIIGKVTSNLQGIGNVMLFFQSPVGIIIVLCIVLCIWILVKKCKKIAKNKIKTFL